MVIEADEIKLSKTAEIGEDVEIKAKKVVIGENVKIGLDTFENFRFMKGVRVSANSLIIGDDSVIGKSVLIKGGNIEFGKAVNVKDGCTINAVKSLKIGDRAGIGQNCIIEGYEMIFGNDLWMRPNVQIGGGVCFEKDSYLKVGDFCHITEYAHINTADKVIIGDMVGLGRSIINSHGIFLSYFKGYPLKFGSVEIGNNCWLPNAIVVPGVKIGDNVIVGAGSLVNKDIPAGSFAFGMPAKIITKGVYPVKVNDSERFELIYNSLAKLEGFLSVKYKTTLEKEKDEITLNVNDVRILYKPAVSANFFDTLDKKKRTILVFDQISKYDNLENFTFFDINKFEIKGKADEFSHLVLDHLRRYGNRFKFAAKRGSYVPWSEF